MAPSKRRQSAAGRDSGDWADQRDGAGGDDRQRALFQKWPTAGGLAGAGTQTALDRRQAGLAGYQQTRRQLLAHLADSWGALSYSSVVRQARRCQSVAQGFAGTASDQRGGRGTGEQERTDRVGYDGQ